ncbi:MAG: hypothetical protein WBV94_01825 [Blastocatellia bacterium]
MIDISALDNVIAVVVVILLLSLIVQSIQSVLKKAFKIKSRQVEDSLIDLFENVLHYTPEAGKTSGWFVRVTAASPILRKVYTFLSRTLHPADPAAYPPSPVKTLFDEVTRGFQQVGRVAQTGKQMLDSVSKADLEKVMGKVLPNTLLPGFSGRLEAACAHITSLDAAVKDINDHYLSSLSGEASAKFALMQQQLAPLLNDLRAVYNGQQLSPALLIGDITNLRDIKLEDALQILGQIQQKVASDLAEASKAQASGSLTGSGLTEGLTALSEGLAKIAQALTRLSEGLDSAITPLRTKLGEVETWYDTVMHSFEERYTRGMKTWAIVISFLVVAYLNANVFDIYKNISTNDALRNQLVQFGEERTKSNEQRLAKAKEADNDEQIVQTLDDIRKDSDEIKRQIAEYSSFGFHSLTWQKVKARVKTLWVTDGWVDRRKEELKTLIGWIVMTFLLSVGAPFWQDTLESLFGVKNLLRKKSDTKNVESESGAGQPRP